MMQADDGDRLIQDVLAELGWDADPRTIADNVRRLDLGLPVEDQFIAICAWLGKARLVHKLDQLQAPLASRYLYQVPDLLAHFDHAGPLLIEVKAKKGRTLSLRPDYLAKLQAYAELVRMPLLIAWKHYGIWTLFEARHLKRARTNFNISFSDAIAENLLGTLAGDVAYKIEPGAGVRFGCKKEELLSIERDGDTHTEHWRMRIDQVGFTIAGGKPVAELDPEVATLFTTWDLEERQSHSDTHVELAFVAGDEGMMFGHMALTHLLNWSLPIGAMINWRHAIRRDAVVANMTNFGHALARGLEQKVVRTILHQQPNSWPDFIPRPQGPGDGGRS